MKTYEILMLLKLHGFGDAIWKAAYYYSVIQAPPFLKGRGYMARVMWTAEFRFADSCQFISTVISGMIRTI